MKITAVEAFTVDFFRANFVFARIETDTGIEGVGEGSVEFAEQAVADTIGYFAPMLLGENPYDVERLTELLNRESYWRMGIVHRSAL
ncbi:MAG: mandelate racemase, partial [Proteobacteria bacterium]|nr:mandelate racemase [Pseudomonadota bacterium]